MSNPYTPDPKKRPDDKKSEPYRDGSNPHPEYKPKEKPPSPYDNPKPQKRPPYDGGKSPEYDPDEASMRKSIFEASWELMKFGDCPVCHGDPMACPSPDVPLSSCPTRRNAIKHMKRGKGGKPPITLHD